MIHDESATACESENENDVNGEIWQSGPAMESGQTSGPIHEPTEERPGYSAFQSSLRSLHGSGAVPEELQSNGRSLLDLLEHELVRRASLTMFLPHGPSQSDYF